MGEHDNKHGNEDDTEDMTGQMDIETINNDQPINESVTATEPKTVKLKMPEAVKSEGLYYGPNEAPHKKEIDYQQNDTEHNTQNSKDVYGRAEGELSFLS